MELKNFYHNKEIIANIFSNHWVKLLADSEFKEEDFIKADLLKLPSHQIYYKLRAILFYIQIINHTKPNRGDIQDMRQSVYLPYCNIFVTNDKNLLKIVELFKKELNSANNYGKCVSFEYLRKNIICHNC